MTDHSPSDAKKTLQPLTQRRQRPFYIGMFGSQGELRAYDRVCIMCRAISAFSLSTNTSVTYLGFMPRVPILA